MELPVFDYPDFVAKLDEFLSTLLKTYDKYL